MTSDEISVTPAPVISAEFLLDHGDEDQGGALHSIAANDGEHSDVSFRTEDRSPEQVISDYNLSSRCGSTKVEQVYGKPVTRRCTRKLTPGGEHHQQRWTGDDDMHEWMRIGHRVRWN